MSCPRILETKMAKIRTPMEVATFIQEAITRLSAEGRRSEDLIEAKAKAVSEYDKLIGMATGRLKAEGVQTTLVGQLAKERASDALYAKIVAEESLKAHYSNISILESILNGWQSYNRYLQTVSRGD